MVMVNQYFTTSPEEYLLSISSLLLCNSFMLCPKSSAVQCSYTQKAAALKCSYTQQQMFVIQTTHDTKEKHKEEALLDFKNLFPAYHGNGRNVQAAKGWPFYSWNKSSAAKS